MRGPIGSMKKKERLAEIAAMIGPLAMSRSRPSKPPAKVIHARHSAALSTGGGRLPAKLRKKLDRQALVPRLHPADPGPHGPAVKGTRAGKRVPKAAKRPARPR